MVVARKIAYNVVFNTTAKIISTALALVGIGFITRYLGTEGFGNYATVLAFFSFFMALADLGMYTVATREISRDGADERFIMNNVVTLRFFSAILVIAIAVILSIVLPYPVSVRIGILIAAAAFLFSSLYIVLNGVFQKRLAMDRVATAELVGKCIQLAIIIAAVRWQLGFTVVISSILAAMAVNCILVYWFSRAFLPIRPMIDWHYWKAFLHESVPLGISVLVTFIYLKTDTILLSFLKGSAEVGVYNAAYKIIENLSYFPGMIIGLMLPIMAQTVFSNRERFEEISDKTLKVFLLMVIPLAIGTLFLADDIIAVIGGGAFRESAGVLRLLIISLSFIFFGNFFNAILVSGNLQRQLMYVLAGCAVLNVSANLLLIPRFSYMGAAFSSLITEGVVVAFGWALTVRRLGYHPRNKQFGNLLFAAAAMAVTLWIARGTPFVICALLGMLAYGGMLWLTRTVTVHELRSIISRTPELPPEKSV